MSNSNGGIFFDDTDEEKILGDEVKEKPILDLTVDERKAAQEKVASGEMLFPEEEEEIEEKLSTPKAKRERPSKKVVREVDQNILDEVGDALGVFDAETANKREIRTLRKALQALSQARYPKRERSRKEKKTKKK